MDWITDRLPTEADGDKDGDVIAFRDARWYTYSWSTVRPGQPWLLFTPPATPSTSEPTPSTPAPLTRRIISTNRTVHPNGVAIIDAVADDGTAWWIAQDDDDNGWRQLPPLPDREIQP